MLFRHCVVLTVGHGCARSLSTCQANLSLADVTIYGDIHNITKMADRKGEYGT